MEDLWHLALGTVTMRPYVFAFFAAYLAAAIPHLGVRKTILFTVAGYLIAFLSEVSSINTGFPYGWYYYIDSTRSDELWVLGVPFFDSLSYVFLAYCSYTLAIMVVSPAKGWKWDFITLETHSIRKSFSVLLLASLFQVFLDILIDPVALQGKRWFLGEIYGYQEAGVHFGVPVSNYAGWWFVSFLMILVLQMIERSGGAKLQKPFGVVRVPFRSLYGPLLYLAVIVFNVTVTFFIGENLMGMTGILMFTLPIAIMTVSVMRRINRDTKEELAEHLRDFPWSPVSGRRG